VVIDSPLDGLRANARGLRFVHAPDFVQVKQCAKTRLSQMQHEMEKLIRRAEDQRVLSIGQAPRYGAFEELIHRDSKSHVTEPEMQFDLGP
jgi:hypothetical protein